MTNHPFGTITFNTLVKHYMHLQSQVMSMVQKVAAKVCHATPGKFLLLQFAMSQVTQVGSSISNLLSQVNTVISRAIQNQKTQ